MYRSVCMAVAVAAVLVLVLAVPMGRACPRTCNCYQANEVHCTFRSLLAVPPGLPAHTQRINLGFNSINRIPDSSLAGLKKVELLMLHGNDLHKIPDGAFRDMKSLQVLKLSYNKLKEISSSLTFSGLTSLVRLHLDHNLLQYIHPRALLQLPSLRLLRLQGNRLHQLHPHSLCTMSLLNTYYYSTLRHLDLSNNSLTTLPRETLVTAPLLETLILQANPWSCDCRMSWFLSWSLTHPGLMKCPRGPQCPVCASPGVLQGRDLLQQADLSCASPVISSQGRDAPSEADLGEIQPIESFREPLGAASLSLSDQQGNSVDLSCSGARSTNSPDIAPPPDLSLSSSAPLSLAPSIALDCPVERGSYERLWRILAYYSETAVRLEREIMLSKAPELAYRYRQAVETEGYYHTGVKASVKAKPHWLLQPAISIQLNRAQSSGHRVQLILTTRVSARPDPVSHTLSASSSSSSSSSSPRPWVLISTNHTATAVAAVTGRRVELSCPLLSSGKPTLQWILPDGSKIISPSSSPDGRLRASASVLLLQRAELSDAGLYHCVARAGSDVDVLPLRLAVEESSGPPPGEQMGPSVTALVGKPVNLPCEASGSPTPDISWVLPDGNIMRRGSALSGGVIIQSNGSLSLPHPSLNDVGQYRCMVVNQYGADSLSMWLDFDPRPAPPLRTSFPRGPQSAAGRSTRIRAPLLRETIVLEASGDEEEDEEEEEEEEEEKKIPIANKRRPRPPQPPLNRRYPVGHPRRRGPVRGGPLRRVGGASSSFEQRRNRFDNRHRVGATKQRIDPQKWADLLAKIRQRTLNTTSQPITEQEPTAEPFDRERNGEAGRNVGETDADRERGGGKSGVERGEDGESDREREGLGEEIEGSSIDDASLQEEGLQPVHPVHTETRTHTDTNTNTQPDTEIERTRETERGTDRETDAQTEMQTGRSTETQTDRETHTGTDTQTDTMTSTETQTDLVTSKPISKTNEIESEPVEGGEREPSSIPSRTRPQNPRQGAFPNLVPNSRPQSPWNSRRRIGQRRRIINRPRGRPLTPPRPLPLPDPATPKEQTVTPDTATIPMNTLSLASATTLLAERHHARTFSAPADSLELIPGSPAVSDSVTLSPSGSPSIPESVEIPPSEASTRTPVRSHAAMTQPPAATEETERNLSGGAYVSLSSPPSSTPRSATTTFITTPFTTTSTQSVSSARDNTKMRIPIPSTTTITPITRTTKTTSPITSTPTTTTTTKTLPASVTTRSTTIHIPTARNTTPIPTTTTTTIPTTTTTTTSTTIPTTTTTTTSTTIPTTTKTTTTSTTIPTTTTTTTSTTIPTTTTTTTSTTIPTTTTTTTSTTIPTTTKTTTTSTTIPTTTKTTTTATTIPTTTTTTPSTATTTSKTTRTPITSTSSSTAPTTTTSTSTRGSTRERPSPGLFYPRGRPVSGVPNQSRPSPDWRNPGANSIPDSHGTRPRPPSSPSLPASPGSSAGKPVQTSPLGPLAPVVRSRPRIADPHIRTVSVPAESTARLACEAQGEPKPAITWTKVSTGAVMSVNSRAQRFEVLPNGTFVIQNVQLQDRGTYICSAHSSLGRDRMLTTLEVWSRPPRMQLANYREATIHQGGEVRLDCQADGVPTPVLSWVLPDRSVLTSTGSSHSRMTMHTNGTLHIWVTSPSDRGVYRCVASNSAGAASTSVRVHVSSLPPVIHQAREERLVLIPGMPVYAHCTARGAPPPTLRWRIPDGTLVRPSQFLHGNLFVLPNGTLHIRNVGPKDSGSYECTANNAVGADKRTVRVELQGGSEGHGRQGGRVGGVSSTLHKDSTSSHPFPSSNPLHPTRFSPPSPFNRSRTSPLSPSSPRLPSVDSKPAGSPDPPLGNDTAASPSSPLSPSIPTNNSKFSRPGASGPKPPPSFPANRGRGSSPSALTPVSSLSKARIISTSPSVTSVHYGDSLQLHCSVSGNPPPTIIWRTPNRKLVDVHFSFDRRLKVHANGSLSVQAVTERDAGDYLCIARNKVADDYRLLRISVATKPAKIEPKQPSNQMVSFGGQLKVDCLASGLPDPAVHWSLPDGTMVNSVLQGEERGGRARRLTVFDNGTLLVPAVGMAEEGEYTCYAENQGGQDTMKVKVKVMMTSPPTFTDDRSYDVFKVRQGVTAALRCRATGDPAPTVTWFSPNNRVIPRSLGSGSFSERVVVVSDGTLEIRAAQRNDAGNYTCQASNTAGKRSKVVGLEVEVPYHIGVYGRGRSTGSSSSSGGNIVNTGLNGASHHYGSTNGVTSRLGSNGHSSSSGTYSNGRVSDSVPSTGINLANSGFKPAHRIDNVGVNGPTSGVGNSGRLGNSVVSVGVNGPTNGVGNSGRLGNSVVSVGVSGASNVAIKPGHVVINRYGPGISSANSPVGSGVVNVGGLTSSSTGNNEVSSGRTGNGTSTSVVNGKTGGVPSDTGVISRSASSDGTGTSRVRGSVLSRSSDTGGASSGTSQTVVNRKTSAANTGTSASHASNSAGTAVSVTTTVKQRVVRGQTVILPCPSHGSPPPRLAWLLPGNGVLPAPYYGSRLTVYRNGSLELRGARDSDAGTLVCVVRGDRGETRIQVELAVSGTQEEAEAPRREPAAERPAPRGPFLFESPRSGVPPTSPDSVRSLVPPPPPPLPETLRPRSPVTEKPPQRGPFSPAPPQSISPPLRSGGPVSEPVTSRQQPVVSTRTASLVSIINGENLRLPCHAPTAPGYAQGPLSWTLPSGDVVSRGESAGSGRYSVLEDGTLMIKQTSVFDRGSYSCRSTNHDSSLASVVTVPVIVIAYPPRITTGPSPVTYTRPGVAVELPCLTIATPRATVTWETPDLSQLRVTGQARIYGNRYLSAQGSLVIQNPTSRDTGFYRCTAKNVIGADTKATYLHVI